MVGAMQAEADINCDRQPDYPCLQKQLIRSYRQQFNSSSMNFVAVQLPGYQTGDGVFYMRLAQVLTNRTIKNQKSVGLLLSKQL